MYFLFCICSSLAPAVLSKEFMGYDKITSGSFVLDARTSGDYVGYCFNIDRPESSEEDLKICICSFLDIPKDSILHISTDAN
eukprot:UN07439